MFKQVIILILIVTTLNGLNPEEIVARLTVREKIAQLLVVAAASNFSQPTEQLASSIAESRHNMEPAYIEHIIKEYGVGGVLFLYKSDPITQMALAEIFQAAAALPLLILQDNEWGLSMRLDIDPTKVVRYPRNMTLGAIQDETIIYQVALEIGNQCSAIGIHMNLAPVADINNNKANPVIHDRSFGDNPERVARLAQLVALGLRHAGILACAKHFPGHGDTSIDSHCDLPIITHDSARLDRIELVPFHHLAQSGIDAIMHGHLVIPALDDSGTASSLSHKIVTQFLQKKLGYQGLNITDGLGMDAIANRYAPGELERAAFLAGNDILLCPLDVVRTIELIAAEIETGHVSEEELDRRVVKILRAKKWVYEQVKQIRYNRDTIEAYLTRPEAYALQKEAYRAAITLVPQSDNVTLDAAMLGNSSVIQIGQLPDNRFIKACDEQGCTVLHCSAALTDTEFEESVCAAHRHDTVILAIGQMNKFIAKNFGVATRTCELVHLLHAMGKKLVIALFGTPYSIPLFKNAQAIIMAYEDAPAAQEAVVDVLRGALQPTGILPVQV